MAFSHRSSESPIQKLKKRNCFLGSKCNIQKSCQTPKKKVWKSKGYFLPPKVEPNGHLVIMVVHNINLVHWSGAPLRYDRHLSLMAKFGALARSAFHSATWRQCVCVCMFKWVSSVVFAFLVVFLFLEIKFIVFENDGMTKKRKKKKKMCVCVCVNEFLVRHLCFWLRFCLQRENSLFLERMGWEKKMINNWEIK